MTRPLPTTAFPPSAYPPPYPGARVPPPPVVPLPPWTLFAELDPIPATSRPSGRAVLVALLSTGLGSAALGLLGFAFLAISQMCYDPGPSASADACYSSVITFGACALAGIAVPLAVAAAAVRTRSDEIFALWVLGIGLIGYAPAALSFVAMISRNGA